MKTLTLLALFTGAFALPSTGQALFNMYLLLPDEAATIDLATREKMVENFKEGHHAADDDVYFFFETVDHRNGFLQVAGAMEGAWEMCYWNLEGGKKLIAVHHLGCGPVCGTNFLGFFLLEGNRLVQQPTEEIIPGYLTLYQEFFKAYSAELEDELSEKDIIASFIIQIPRSGKDILVLFGNEGEKEVYAGFAKGDRRRLLWEKGKFTKGEIFWSE
jgi:hypothetical protein